MREFTGKVAVITGAASGIGRGLAQRCVEEGMRVVLADIEAPALAQAEAELRGAGATVLAVPTDVAQARAVEALAERTMQTFGAVHLLCNNAGVGAGGSIWESSLDDWEWVLGVNLWGVIHGVRSFVPLMLAQDTACHVVNTASIAGLLSYHPSASYQVTKHAAVALSEHLYHSLAERQAKIGVSVLCPGWVRTRILESARNRPAARRGAAPPAPPSPELAAAPAADAGAGRGRHAAP
jgi:NAD(P)-dependent dehydrogenase (short-subunit alcohol dehydrogenase family)